MIVSEQEAVTAGIAARQNVTMGAKPQPALDPVRVKTVLERFKKGKITIRQGAEQLGITYVDMDELLRRNETPLVSDLSTALGKNRRRPKR